MPCILFFILFPVQLWVQGVGVSFKPGFVFSSGVFIDPLEEIAFSLGALKE